MFLLVEFLSSTRAISDNALTPARRTSSKNKEDKHARPRWVFFCVLTFLSVCSFARIVTTAPAMGQPGYLSWAAWARVPTRARRRSPTRRTRTSSPRTSPRPTSPSTRSLRTLTRTSTTPTPWTRCTPSSSRSTRDGRASGRPRRAACCTSTAACRTSCAGTTAGKCCCRPATASTRDCRTLSLSMEYLTL